MVTSTVFTYNTPFCMNYSALLEKFVNASASEQEKNCLMIGWIHYPLISTGRYCRI